MRYIIPCILLALTTCLCADEPKSKALRKYENEVEILRKQGQAAIKRLEGVFEKEVEKLREKTLTALQEELDAALEGKDLDKAVALREAIKAFEGAEASGLAAKAEVASQKKIRKRIPRTAMKFEGHHYAVNTAPRTWHVARDNSETLGGHLVRIESAEELAFVAALVKRVASTGIHWIDGSDEILENDWRFSNGQPMTFAPWGIGEPRGGEVEHHAVLMDTMAFGDTRAGVRLPYIIEWDD